MGLDLSLTSTGVSVGGETTVIATKLRGAERLFRISLDVLEIAVAKNVQIVAIEGYSFASRNSHAHSIGELGGCVRMRLWEKGIPFVEIPPTCRAKFATGKGNASKGEVISAISAQTGLVFSGAGADDECDAWILEEMLRAKLGNPMAHWTADKLAALDKVDWSELERLL